MQKINIKKYKMFYFFDYNFKKGDKMNELKNLVQLNKIQNEILSRLKKDKIKMYNSGKIIHKKQIHGLAKESLSDKMNNRFSISM